MSEFPPDYKINRPENIVRLEGKVNGDIKILYIFF